MADRPHRDAIALAPRAREGRRRSARPLTDLLLIVYRRRPTDSDGVEVLGDAQLLDFWLER